jgi:serine/threonine protein kinase/Tfp pilus assembly protein PilF
MAKLVHPLGLTDSIAAVQGKEDHCIHCGATIRVGNGLCVSCSLGATLESDSEASLESFEECLERDEVRDTQWRVGNYQILEEIGRGGMGIIYRARQRHSRRIVALKRLVAHHADSPETLERFRREAEAAASLDHPNIVPIYEVSWGEDGVPFFSMKYAAGGSLQKAAPALRSEPRQCVQLLAKVARAVQYAHEHGILHRDLKPGNILLDGRGEPLVSDFGLAKWLDTNTDLTQTLTIFGTPGYIAPEQANGAREELAPAADVYSLGAILFYLLSGRPPFLGENALAVIQQAGEKTAPKLRSLAPGLDRDLETICGRCLERDAPSRYRSAGDLAADLERWLEGGPIMARRVSLPVRAWRWSRRNPTLAAATGGTLCFAMAAAFLWFTHNRPPSLPPAPKSIAVLPFENLSNAENSYFTQGMHDEILHDLANVADLKVISRTSVMDYRPDKTRNLRQIANALHVAYVLEGSVRRNAERVRVHARLIDARSDTQIWAEQYNRNLTDAFAMQGEIAMAIAKQLQARLSPTEKSAIQRHPTDDLVAFDLYTRAQSLLMKRVNNNQLNQAVELLNQAVAHDPLFFRAFCQLASTNDLLYFLGYDHTPARLAAAEAALARALQLRPEAGEVHLARAQNLYHGYLDYDGALAELAVARQSLPNSPRVFELQGFVERRRNQWESSTKNIERALELDPHNYYTLQQLAITYGVVRRYAEEAAVLDRALAIAPDNIDIRVTRAFVDFHWKADTRALHKTLAEIRAANPAAVGDIAGDWFSCAMAERDPVAAKAALDGMTSPLSDYKVHLSRPVLEALLARMRNEEQETLAAFRVARIDQEKIIQAQPNYGPPLCVLGLIDAGLGRKEDALREARRAVELVPVEKDALTAPQMNAYQAMIAAWLGEKDLAFQQLEIAIRPPSTISYGQLKLLPVWDPLRGDPRFEKIVASLAPN